MKLDVQMITPYLQKQTLPENHHWIYQYTNGTKEILPHRQEIVITLLNELAKYPDRFPLFNHDLICELCFDTLPLLEDITLLPIVGSHASFDNRIIQHNGKTYLLIDLLNVADYTPIVKQMTYILHNMMHVTILQYLIKVRKPTTYIEQLEAMFFIDGFVQYLAWNVDCAAYNFQSETYAKRKEQSFQLLYRAVQVTDSNLQMQILKQLSTTDLWNTFPLACGIFFLDDFYHKEHEKGLCDYFAHGPKDCFKLIF